jgi:hypothetical protein
MEHLLGSGTQKGEKAMNEILNEIQAYPDGSDWVSRALAEYQVGDKVLVGPAYVGGGCYARDEWAGGKYYIVETCGGADYRLACRPGGRWVVIVHAGRLEKIGNQIENEES